MSTLLDVRHYRIFYNTTALVVDKTIAYNNIDTVVITCIKIVPNFRKEDL
jgi:hypothetical protein